MEYRSRRERREAEKAGSVSTADQSENAEHSPETQETKFPSRRELRMQERQRSAEDAETVENKHPLSKTEQPATLAQTKPTEQNQNLENKDNGPEAEGSTTAETAAIDSTPSQLTGRNYIYQDSSNTFTMDNIPDSLESTNGDLVVTNSESIEIVTGNQPSLSSVMDDLKFDSEDQKDTVAGKISLVDPVSAKLVADAREPEIVVPGKIVVRNRVLSTTFAILGGVMFVLAGIGLWWALSEMGPFS
ncbi:MAG: hypothetical protein RI590_03745 [Microbacteriaceae bacterium]|nr:hypothetical protein [Microbacteriaceae bacterium]MDR9443605.1 hypothetical protein [Microbacteriaceae bacterium]